MITAVRNVALVAVLAVAAAITSAAFSQTDATLAPVGVEMAFVRGNAGASELDEAKKNQRAARATSQSARPNQDTKSSRKWSPQSLM